MTAWGVALSGSSIMDTVVAGVFAVAGLVLLALGFVAMMTVVGIPPGLVMIVVGLLSVFIAKGVLQREPEAWLLGTILALAFLIFSAVARDPLNLLVSIGLVGYFILSRERF